MVLRCSKLQTKRDVTAQHPPPPEDVAPLSGEAQDRTQPPSTVAALYTTAPAQPPTKPNVIA